MLALANAYMGMRSYLRAVDMWLNLPTGEPPKLSQLWHRDYDDIRNVKVFVYLTDVGVEREWVADQVARIHHGAVASGGEVPTMAVLVRRFTNPG